MSPDDKRTCAMAAAGLLEPYEYMHLVRPPRVKRKRRPSLAKAIKTARKAGIDKGSVTVGDVTVTFGEADPTTMINPWLADLDKATKQ